MSVIVSIVIWFQLKVTRLLSFNRKYGDFPDIKIFYNYFIIFFGTFASNGQRSIDICSEGNKNDRNPIKIYFAIGAQFESAFEKRRRRRNRIVKWIICCFLICRSHSSNVTVHYLCSLLIYFPFYSF